MKEIVVLGGGFAGVFAAKTLLKKTKRSDVQITLIDKNSYQLFTPSLYEVASSEEPQKNVCIPLHEILQRVEIIKGEVQKIDKEKREISYKNHPEILENLRMKYDYLIVALGSEPDFREIPGLEQHSIPFKTLDDAVKIRNLISKSLKTPFISDSFQTSFISDSFQTSFIKKKKKDRDVVRVLVGGGGASGCEFAAELAYHLRNVKISLIQKSPQLVKELNMEAARIAYKRLLNKDVEICFGERIAKVFEDHAETDKGNTYKFDIFVWAGGIKGSSVLKNSGFDTDEKGRLKVNESLQVEDDIFAAGDAAFLSSNIPQTVRVAREQGEIAGENVARKIKGENLVQYKFKYDIFIVPLVGKYAVVQFNNFLIKGLVGWLIQQLVFLRYLLSILPLNKALKRWNRFEEYLMK